ncbi:MAG: radical SAM protein [Elusimicrobia bacterium]|nr:radical SAM protein [Candidatus Liberimonas magnetica]
MKNARKNIPPGKCFYTWDIHYACNYRCSYCFFNDTWEEEKKKNRYPGIEEWKRIWGDIYDKYGEGHLHISGGEPFHYPGFIELVSFLTDKFTVEFDTNLSFDVDEFMKKIPPDRVRFAASFHPQFADFGTFLKKAKALKDGGYDLGVNYVAFPEQLARMEEYKSGFDIEHISFDVMPFRGKYKGKEYPQSYTKEERELVCKCDPRTAPKMLESYGDKNDGDKKEKPLNPHLGKLCRMGQVYTKIHSNGNAYRCCLIKEEGKIGNLIDGTFALYDEPKECRLDKCPCWVAMIVDEEKNWLFHWQTPKIKTKS